MRRNHTKATIARIAFVVAVAVGVLACASGAQAAPPVKEVVAFYSGAKVDKLTGENICTTKSGDACQSPETSSVAGGFDFPEAVATGASGEVYVADAGNHRVQEFTASGTFMRMFGADVNKTTGENTCTAESHDVCQAGTGGTNPAQLANITGIAVSHGDIYVAEEVGLNGGQATARVQEFTPEGQFVLEIGNQVNTSNKTNLCTQGEIGNCTAPMPRPVGTPASTSEPFMSDRIVIAVGAPEELLYVGDEHRVQEFSSDGQYKGELALTSISAQPKAHVAALAANATGEIYLTYEYGTLPETIYKFNANGEEVKEHYPITLAPRTPDDGQYEERSVYIDALATDAEGRLGVTELETLETPPNGSTFARFGSLLNGETGHLITNFTIPGERNADGIAFSADDDLYAVTQSHELVGYEAVPVAELVTETPGCEAGPEHESSDTINCNLKAEVNPESVPGTEAWFEWGSTCTFGKKTKIEPLETLDEPVPVSALIEGLKPNEEVCYRIAGEDQNAKAPEQLTSESTIYSTESLPPKVVGSPSTVAAGPFSAVMLEEINPEHTNTEYFFEYGTCSDNAPGECAGSPYPSRTSTLESSQYGAIDAIIEAAGLQPDSLYHYRLAAINDKGMRAVNIQNQSSIHEGEFRTAPAPKVEVETRAESMVSAISALVSGTVNPDGEAAAYTFELGIYKGTSTQYGVVSSGSAGEGTTPVDISLQLTGLLPGTEYAYRISAHSGDGSTEGSTAVGAIRRFTTAAEPTVLPIPVELGQLPIPPGGFPKPPPAPETNAQKLTKALKTCKKMRNKKQRTTCEKKARKKYSVKKK
jgi:hypothetical protein